MKLLEAQILVNAMSASGLPDRSVYLAASFTALHFGTFLTAHLQQLSPGARIHLGTGLYGDLDGNLDRMNQSGAELGIVNLEWADLDARLGVRALGGWTRATLADVLTTVAGRLGRIAERLAAARMRVTVVLPTLPLPPAAHQRPDQMGKWESDLRLLVADFASRIAGLPNVAVLHPNTMDETSPVQNRRDLAMELRSGFPYTIPHADALAAAIARQATPRASLKALITDLDNTMWEGILGEDGVEAVHWDLHHGSHMHALYQQFLASLADAGIMIGVASKNPPELAHAALSRPDMHVRPEMIFPVEAGWNVKSQSIARILRAWNIAPDAVVFVDDSPLELEEVRAEFPDIQCRVFPAGDPRGIWDLLADLRGLFGRNHVTEEDSLRVQSLRTRAEFDALSHGADGTADFLETVQATIDLSFRKQPAESRAFELVNKTNQFNLNGRRYTTASWTSYLQHPRSFLVSATYRDKFGQLGQISVALGHQDGSTATIDAWVMSCRAFSRRIEHRILHELFECFQLDALRLNFEPTNRNGPLSEFFESVTGKRQTGPFTLARSAFEARCPTLHHVVAHEASVRTVQNEQ